MASHCQELIEYIPVDGEDLAEELREIFKELTTQLDDIFLFYDSVRLTPIPHTPPPPAPASLLSSLWVVLHSLSRADCIISYANETHYLCLNIINAFAPYNPARLARLGTPGTGGAIDNGTG